MTHALQGTEENFRALSCDGSRRLIHVLSVITD